MKRFMVSMYSGQQKFPSILTPPIPPPPEARPPKGTSAPRVSARESPDRTCAPVDGFRVDDFSTGFSTLAVVGFGLTVGSGTVISGVFGAGGVTTGLASGGASA